MKNEKIIDSHVEELAYQLSHIMEFEADDIEIALRTFERCIDKNVYQDNIVGIYGDTIIFNGTEDGYGGIDVATRKYLNDYECYNIINPDFLII